MVAASERASQAMGVEVRGVPKQFSCGKEGYIQIRRSEQVLGREEIVIGALSGREREGCVCECYVGVESDKNAWSGDCVSPRS